MPRVTEAPVNTPGTRLGGRSEKGKEGDMGKTISFVKGKGSITHNNRDFIADNVDRDRMAWNEYYVRQPIKEAYEQIFGPAVEEYNAKQKRKDRQIVDYLTDIKNSGNKEKQFYEIVVQIGKKEDTGVLDDNGELSEAAKAAKEILDEYARSFQQRNPNLYLFNAVLHMDEATPHLHLDYIPVAHGYKTKMHTRNSLTKALQEMGIEPATSRNDNETMHWQLREREFLMELCQERNLEVEILGEKRDNYTILEYKAARQAAEQLTAELEILNAEKQEVESIIAEANEQVNEKAELVEESKQQLEEINSQIEDKEKEYFVHEKKLEKLLAAEKPVKRELALIKQDTKQLPALLGGEPYFKISGRNLDKLMDIAQGAGTLKNLNLAYERELSVMEKSIIKLKEREKTLKVKLKQYELFVEIKGLVDVFKEFIRPKTIQEQLEEKKAEVELQKKAKTPKVNLKKEYERVV